MNPSGQTALCRVFPWIRECPGRAAWRVPRLQLCKGRVIPWAQAPRATVPTLLHRSPRGTAGSERPNPHSRHCQVFRRRVSVWFQGAHLKPSWHLLCWLKGKLCMAGTCQGHPWSRENTWAWDLSLFIYFTTFLLFIVTDGCQVREAENDAWGFFIFQEVAHWKVWNLLCVFNFVFLLCFSTNHFCPRTD